VIGAGTGMYFGNSDGNHPFWGGLIENNLIMNTIGYNLQIKHQNPRPRLPGMPLEWPVPRRILGRGTQSALEPCARTQDAGAVNSGRA
jgi:hypothetical protein